MVNPLQYSCLENPIDRGPWQATVHSIAESYTTEQLRLQHFQLLQQQKKVYAIIIHIYIYIYAFKDEAAAQAFIATKWQSKEVRK